MRRSNRAKLVGLMTIGIGLGIFGALGIPSAATLPFAPEELPSTCLSYAGSLEITGNSTLVDRKARPQICRVARSEKRAVRGEVVWFEGVEFVAGEILVRFRDGVSEEEIRRILADVGCEIEEYIPLFRIYHLRTVEQADAAETLAKVAELNRLPEVDFAEPNLVYRLAAGSAIPNDPAFPWQWSLHNTGQKHPSVAKGSSSGSKGADIGILQAWAEGWTDSRAVVVAVIDSGVVPLKNSDLQGNILWDAAYDFARNDGEPNDEVGHGTFVAGIIGAVGNNGKGISGIAWRASLVPLKAEARLSVWESMERRFRIFFGLDADDFYKGMLATLVLKNGLEILEEADRRWIPLKIRHRAEQGRLNIRVLNLSFATDSPKYLDSLRKVLSVAQRSGILVVAAAGNGGSKLDPSGSLTYPCALGSEFENVVCVGASTDRDELASFSNYGAAVVHLVAPGQDVVGLVPPPPAPGDLPLLKSGWCRRVEGEEELAVCSGTSFATAHVSGVAALLFARCPEAEVSEIRELLKNSVKQIGNPPYQNPEDQDPVVAWGGRLQWPSQEALGALCR